MNLGCLEQQPQAACCFGQRVSFSYLFKLLSAGVRQPRYSGVGCIYQKGGGGLLFSCKKAYELLVYSINLKWGEIQKRKSRASILHLGDTVYSRMVLFTSKDFLLPFPLHTMKCGLMLLIYCIGFMVLSCVVRRRGQCACRKAI